VLGLCKDGHDETHPCDSDPGKRIMGASGSLCGLCCGA